MDRTVKGTGDLSDADDRAPSLAVGGRGATGGSTELACGVLCGACVRVLKLNAASARMLRVSHEVM